MIVLYARLSASDVVMCEGVDALMIIVQDRDASRALVQSSKLWYQRLLLLLLHQLTH
jgi:hypothetical protein